MQIIRFMVTNLADGGALTYSTQDTNFPATNVAHRWHTRHWRSSDGSLTSQWLKWDLGSAQAIKAFLLRYNNFQTGATVQIQGNASDSWGAPSYNSTLTVDNGIMYDFPSSTQTYRWWRLLISDAGNPDNHLRVGRVYLGTYVEPDKNFHRRFRMRFRDPSALSISEGGQISSVKRTKFKAWGYLFDEVSKVTMQKFETMFDDKGLTGNLFVTQDADDAQESSYYVRFATDLDWEHVLRDAYYKVKITVEELR